MRPFLKQPPDPERDRQQPASTADRSDIPAWVRRAWPPPGIAHVAFGKEDLQQKPGPSTKVPEGHKEAHPQLQKVPVVQAR